MNLILASGSPRRRKFLEQLGIEFKIHVAEVDEIILKTPVETCVHNAVRKARWVWNEIDGGGGQLVIAFDTIVVLEDKILGKPDGRKESINMLEQMSGKWHEVYTGVAIINNGVIDENFDRTGVKFHELTDYQIKHYVGTGKTLDKAGSYGIQDENMSFIETIDGSFSNVVGFPFNVVISMLRKSGFRI